MCVVDQTAQNAQGNRIRCNLEQLLRGDWFRQTRERLLALTRNLVGELFASR